MGRQRCIHLGVPTEIFFGQHGCGSCRAYECEKVAPKLALPFKLLLDDERVQSCKGCPYKELPEEPPLEPGCGIDFAAVPKLTRNERGEMRKATTCACVTWGKPQAIEVRWFGVRR